MEADRRFRAMGTEVHVIVHGDPALVDVAQREIERLEQLWSRFLPHSEVSRLTTDAGSWVEVSPETVQLVERALLAHTVTDGWFDPTVLGDVIRAGYDQSFDALVRSGDRATAPTSDLRQGADQIEIDAAHGRVRLPQHVGFDPGGVGKGLAADLVATRLDAEGVAGALINIGGDLRAIGVGPAGDDWTVELDPAATGTPIATVSIDHGAVATSTTLRRHWVVDGEERHHLIDPRTGAPTTSDVASAMVLAAHGWQAEALAKACLVAGQQAGFALVERLGADALLVDTSGELHPSPGFARFLASAAPPLLKDLQS